MTVGASASGESRRDRGEYRTTPRAALALRLVLLVVVTALVFGVVAASAFVGLIYRLASLT